MKLLATVLGLSAAASVKKVEEELPSTRFTDPDHVSVPHPHPKATECSHTTCTFVALPTPLGTHEVMRVVHDNLESKCSRYQTVSRNAGLANHVEDASKRVHCGRVKTWVVDTTSPGAHEHHVHGHYKYDGPCECHVAGQHPNGGKLDTVEAAVAATKAPVAAGETIFEVTVDAKLKLEGLTVAAFTEAAQLGVRIAFAKATGVHRNDVKIENIQASSGRRLAEAAAGVEFDVLVNIFNQAKATEVTTQLNAVADVPATATQFQEVVVTAMVAEAKAEGESTAILQAAAATIAAAPTTSDKSMKAGCYFKLPKCPKHRGWETNGAPDGWKYHSSRTKLGKAACEHTAYGHHLNCGLEDWEQSKTMWLTADGPEITEFPKKYTLGGTGTRDVADSGWGCPTHYMEVTDSEECKTAGRAVVGDDVYDALPHPMQKGSGLHNGKWTNPTNCGYRAGAYMTFGTTAGKDGWWPKVCKLVTKNDGGCSIREGIRRQHWKGEGNTLTHIGSRNGGTKVTNDSCCAACQARDDCKSWSMYVGTTADNFPDGLCRLLDQEWHPTEGTWHTNSKYASGGRN